MAKINISFNNKDYSIGESAFSSASDALQLHLSTVMNGSGTVVTLGGTSYNIDSTKLFNAMNTFISHLGTIAGSGSKVVVNGVEYPVDSAKMDDAISELETALGDLASGGGSSDADVIASGSCGDNATWRLTENGALTISGTGAMDEFTFDNATITSDAPWFDHISEITSVVIEDGITSIGAYAFRLCAKITEINFPNSVTSIGKCAFMDCSSLRSVTIPDSVTDIGNQVFCNCTSLTSITFPDSVTSIGHYLFKGCTGLQSITFGTGLTYIGSYCCQNCNSLTYAYFPTVGWKVKTVSSSSWKTVNLITTSTAATYLKSTYVTYEWKR